MRIFERAVLVTANHLAWANPAFFHRLGADDIIRLVEVCHLYISVGHNFFGHHGREPDHYPSIEVTTIECIAGHGIRGDRFFDYRDNYKGQITFFAREVFDEVCDAFELRDCSPSLVRRNVITAGVDLNGLIGTDFQVQGVRFYGTEECRPCYWMNQALGNGAEKFLQGRGGLRARIISDGVLSSTAAATSSCDNALPDVEKRLKTARTVQDS